LRTLPAGLGRGALAVLHSPSFMCSGAVGDMPKGPSVVWVHADIRSLDEWVLTVNGARSFDLRPASASAWVSAGG
jgi:hypothetical protein